MYPLDGRHWTNDIGPNKNPPGIPNDVHLAPGPNRHPQGSYQFSGSVTSYIEIPNNGGLETRYSITVLAWLKSETDAGPIFVYGDTGFRLWIVGGGVYANDQYWSAQPKSKKVSNSWYHVGATYDYSSGIAKVWVNGEATAQVNSPDNIIKHFTKQTFTLRMNGKSLRFKNWQTVCCLTTNYTDLVVRNRRHE